MKKYILGTTMLVLLSSTALFAGANAGVEQEVHSGEQVELSGAESTLERNGKFVRFNWRQTEGEVDVSLSKRRSLQTTFTAPTVTESTVLTFRLTTKERFNNRRNRKRTFRSRDYVDVVVLPEDDVITSIPDTNTENNPEVIQFKGFNYLPVTSPETGRVWLDRNLGAKKLCTNASDVSCFGDLYQWGREADGHQKRTSLVKRDGAIDINLDSTNFVTSTEDASYFYVGDWAFGDNNGSIRKKNWSNINGKSICPINYRVPTSKELLAEVSNLEFLNLPNAGYRNDYFGRLITNADIHLWTVTTEFESDFASSLFVSSKKYEQTGIRNITPRANGYSVRCIKN